MFSTNTFLKGKKLANNSNYVVTHFGYSGNSTHFSQFYLSRHLEIVSDLAVNRCVSFSVVVPWLHIMMMLGVLSCRILIMCRSPVRTIPCFFIHGDR
jgi:hypothetical protein